MRRCLLDLDGVITNFFGAAIRIHGLEKEAATWPKGVYDIQRLSGLSPEEFYRPMGHEFWSSLDFLDDADDIIQLVEEHFQPYNICILTKPSNNIGCFSGKAEWIHRNLPQYRRNFLIGAAKHFCANGDSLLIDDSEENVRNFNTYGGEGVLVARPWNRDHEHDTLTKLRNDLAKAFR